MNEANGATSSSSQAVMCLERIGGHMTKLLELHAQKSALQIVFVPGNPSVVIYYQEYLDVLYDILKGGSSVTTISHTVGLVKVLLGCVWDFNAMDITCQQLLQLRVVHNFMYMGRTEFATLALEPDYVDAKFTEELPEALLESNPALFSQLTLVIATQNVMLIIACSYGLAGLLCIGVEEHDVIESKPDNKEDL
ncbi:unnamed protein product [Sphagnum tenellum]